jgi:hypothetical protein
MMKTFRVAAMVAVPLVGGALLLSAWRDSRPDKIEVRAEDVLERSRAAYAALHSYSDAGTVLTEERPPGAPLIAERHTFTTYYSAPRHFFFDFREDPRAGGDRLVIWCSGEAFETWWSATRVHETYPRGTGANAFALASLPTKGSALEVPPLLFAQAGLQGPLVALKAGGLAETEDLDGHRAHKLVGEVSLAYATGRGAHVRPTTVWIDAQTLLVRKVLEDTPAGAPAGSVSRVTTTFEPKANPALGDAQFRFAVPGEK